MVGEIAFIRNYLSFITSQLIPDLLNLLDSLAVASGVSWLGLVVGVTLLCLLIGSVVMRV